jgi:DnaA family protein
VQQLILEISPPPTPTLDNFVPGDNVELLARLKALAAGEPSETVIYLWGEPGSGRSHLLEAAARAAGPKAGLHLADDVERLDETGQIGLFNRINAARDDGSTVLAAGPSAPMALKLREDLRTRLGSGLVYQVRPLSDADKLRYLRAEAGRRGLALAEEVLSYLLTHVRRDMPTLGAILDALDRYSLEQQRAVTLPLLRAALARTPKS